mmetsp:Transcript_47718/g.139072  ORF Transcript_47718/g.139072 Transcript_47718/m.139072 type:complete len:1627 (-) Transcript_47718:186-5066(-)
MASPCCIRAPSGAADTLSQEQVDRYLGLLSAAHREVVCVPSFEATAKQHVKSLGLQRLEGDALREAVCAVLRGAESLQAALCDEFGSAAALPHLLAAHALHCPDAAANGGIDESRFPAFVRFCLAYRIHCYFETSCLTPPDRAEGGGAAATAVAAAEGTGGRPQVVFVLGGPGAGKGTQCSRISRTYGYVHLSAGDLLREERSREGSQYGQLIEDCIKGGKLVPAEITVVLIEQAMRRQGWEQGKYLVDGFPRSDDNFRAWKTVIGEKAEVKFTLFFECSEACMEARLLERGKTSGRVDDNIESIRKRFITFRKDSMPVIDRFRRQGLLRTVSAEQSKEGVWSDVQALFGPSVVFVLGGPGVGKGTQCARIVGTFGYQHLSAGDLLRAERQRPGSEVGELIEGYIREGKIVPVEITVGLLVKAMEQGGWEGGRYLVDGFPRSLDNWEGWKRVVGSRARVLFAITLECGEDVMEARLLERGKTSGRVDDNIESIRKRFVTFKAESMPVIEVFQNSGLLRRINAEQTTDQVWEDVRKLFAPTVVFILGGPGSGKGTQSSRMSPSFRFHHLSPGNLLREEAARPGSEYGELINECMKQGKLVPVEVVIPLLRAAMEMRGWEGGRFVLDGFPRSFEILERWEQACGNKVNVKFVLYFECSEPVMLQRVLNRGKTSNRIDDNMETVKQRLRVYEEECMPVVQKFMREGLLRKINAEQPPDDVWSCVQEVMHNELDAHIRNRAVVYIKPHARTAESIRFLQSYLTARNIAIISKGKIDDGDVDGPGMFAKQYDRLIARAESDPASMDLPTASQALFEKAAGVSWATAVAQGQVYSAAGAMSSFGLSPAEVFDDWRQATVTKLTAHLQVGYVGAESRLGKAAGGPRYLLNGFVPHWRDTFFSSGNGVAFFIVEFDPKTLPWRRFRSEIIGATNPAQAAPDSIRAQMYKEWSALKLGEQPDMLNNCVHASAGPLEALRERMLWAAAKLSEDPFSRLLMSSGVPPEVLEEWIKDPYLDGWPGADKVTGDDRPASLFECSFDVDSAAFRDAAVRFLKRQQQDSKQSLAAWALNAVHAAGEAAPWLRSVSKDSKGAAGKAEEGPPPQRMTILHFNDVYNVEARKQEPVGGLSRFVTRMNELKEEALARGEKEALVLFSGDAFNPSLTSTITMGQHMVTGLNFVGINTACYGNHDFDFGVDQLVKMASETNFPWLISNVTEKETGRPLAEGGLTRVINYHGRKIGLVGLVEHEWLVTLATLDPDDVEYEDFCKCGRRLAKHLKSLEGAEIVIALTHMRVPNDELLAHTVPEIDMILAGHDHHYDVKPVGPHGTYVLKSGTDFRDITAVQIDFGAAEGSKKFTVVKTEHAEIVSSIAEHPEVKVFVDECVAKVGDAMDKTLGECAVDLDCRFQSIRTRETNAGNFVTDVMRKALNADLAVLNSGTLRADSIIERGPFKMRDLVSLLPMLDELCLLQLTGQQIMSVLENSVCQYPRLEGRFAQVSGVTFTFDAALPPGSRVDRSSVKIGGQSLDESRKYTLCTKDYLRQGKDGYDVFREATCLADGEQAGILPSMIRDYFQNLALLNGESELAPKAATARASQLAAGGDLVKVGDGPDLLRRFAIQPKVEGRIVCLNPVM